MSETASAWSHPAYHRVADLLGAQTGLAFPAARLADAEAGIRRAMGRAGIGELPRYLAAMASGQIDLEGLISELTVGETYFFREPLQWELLRDEVLPSLARLRPAQHGLRLWSAGCASGEEAYSLAILLDELGLAGRSQILATDLSREALERARIARYGPWSLRGVDPARIAAHFSPHGARWHLHDRLRQRVRLERLNLAADAYPSFGNGTWRMDLILCRNVLIYLDEATVRRVARQLGDCLAPGGWLFTGPSDPSVNEDGDLEPVVTKAGVVYRKPVVTDATTLPATTATTAPSPLQAPSPLRGEGWGEAAAPPPAADHTNDHRLSPTLSTPWRGRPDEEERVREGSRDPLDDARAALSRGDYERARALAAPLPTAEAAAVCVRAAANGRGVVEAEQLAAEAVARYPSGEELHLLHAVLLLDLGRHTEAAQAARRALYLDRGLVMGHFLLGTALARLEDVLGARRAFRNARALCAPLPADQPVPFGDGQRAAGLAEAAEAQLQLLTAEGAS